MRTESGLSTVGDRKMNRAEQLVEPLEEVHLKDYLRIIQKHRWLVIGAFFVVVVTATIGTLSQTPIYEAVTTILIEREPPKILNIQDVKVLDTQDQAYYQTQYEIIKSRPVIQKVIENLGLAKRMPALEKAQDPVEALLTFVEVVPKRNTRLVQVKVEYPDPALAAEVANAIGHTYERFNLEIRLKSTRDAVGWLADQVGELKAQVQDSELALQRYREKAGMVNIEQQRMITAQKIVDANKAYLDAQAERLAREARLRELEELAKDRKGPQLAIVLGENPLIQKLRAEVASLEIELSKALRVYKEKHPEVQKLRSQIEQANGKIQKEIRDALNAVTAEYQMAKSREEAMLKRLNDLKREALELNEKEIQYQALLREANTSQQLYELVLKRMKETGLAQGQETTNVQVVEEAVVPFTPVKPRKALNISLSIVVGLIFGIGLAFFREYLDTTVRTPEDVERHLGLPVMGIVPLFERRDEGG